jgi:SAM-dependent methyltransferase
MSLLPWRVRNFLSEHFPLPYHLVVNAGTRGNSREHWDTRLKETWDRWKWPVKTDLIANLTRPEHALVDIACGTGSILRALKSRGYHNLHGLDVSTVAIERLSNAGISMHSARLPYIPMPDAQFDAVIASQILEHIVRRGLLAREIARVLTPGGQVFIFVPDDCLGPIDEPEHVTKFNRRSLMRFLARHFDAPSVDVITETHFPMPILFGHGRKPARRASLIAQQLKRTP